MVTLHANFIIFNNRKMLSKFFSYGTTSKDGRSSNRSSSAEGKAAKKGVAKKKIDKYMEEAFKADFDDDISDQRNQSQV